MVKNVWLIGIAVLVGLGGTAGASLLNPSFENPQGNPPGEYAVVPDSWTQGSTGTTVYTYNGTAWYQPIPDGNQVVELGYGREIWQNTGIQMEEGWTYTVSVYGQSGASTGNDIYVGILGAVDTSTRGATVSLLTVVEEAIETWKVYQVSYECDSEHDGRYLGVRLQGPDNGWGCYDMVSLEMVPEPATMGMLAIGGVFALIRRKT